MSCPRTMLQPYGTFVCFHKFIKKLYEKKLLQFTILLKKKYKIKFLIHLILKNKINKDNFIKNN